MIVQLDQTEDIDDRKAIRSRIQELRAIERGTVFLYNKHTLILLSLDLQLSVMKNWRD